MIERPGTILEAPAMSAVGTSVVMTAVGMPTLSISWLITAPQRVPVPQVAVSMAAEMPALFRSAAIFLPTLRAVSTVVATPVVVYKYWCVLPISPSLSNSRITSRGTRRLGIRVHMDRIPSQIDRFESARAHVIDLCYAVFQVAARPGRFEAIRVSLWHKTSFRDQGERGSLQRRDRGGRNEAEALILLVRERRGRRVVCGPICPWQGKNGKGVDDLRVDDVEIDGRVQEVESLLNRELYVIVNPHPPPGGPERIGRGVV